MFMVGDKVRLVKRGRITNTFKLGETYKVIKIGEMNFEVTNETFSQVIEKDCFEPAFLEEIIWLEGGE